MPESAAQLWNAYLASGAADTPVAGAAYTTWQFGDGVERGDSLLGCVLDGPKRATTGALWAYEAERAQLDALNAEIRGLVSTL